MTIDSETNQLGLPSRAPGGMFPESRPNELSVSAALVVSRLSIALSLSLDDVAVDVVFLPVGVFNSEGCEFVAAMVLDASAPLTIEAVVTSDLSHDTGRKHSQDKSGGLSIDRLFGPSATVPLLGRCQDKHKRDLGESRFSRNHTGMRVARSSRGRGPAFTLVIRERITSNSGSSGRPPLGMLASRFMSPASNRIDHVGAQHD